MQMEGFGMKPLTEVGAVLLDVTGPLRRHISVGKDGLHRALGFTGTTVDALFGVDVVLVLPFVDAIDRANLHATGVLGFEAGFGDDVGHDGQILG
jgi:hypothetical protein